MKDILSGFRYLAATVIGRAHFPNKFNLVEKGMNFEYLLHTVALVVQYEEVYVAADATKCILEVFECGFSVDVVAGKQYEVGDRFDELIVVRMVLKRDKQSNPDRYDVLVLGTAPSFHVCKFVCTLANVKEVRNYWKLFIYQVQTLFLALNCFQKTNNPFSGVIFK